MNTTNMTQALFYNTTPLNEIQYEDSIDIVFLSYLLNILFVLHFVFSNPRVEEPYDYETFCLYMDEYKKIDEETLNCKIEKMMNDTFEVDEKKLICKIEKIINENYNVVEEDDTPLEPPLKIIDTNLLEKGSTKMGVKGGHPLPKVEENLLEKGSTKIGVEGESPLVETIYTKIDVDGKEKKMMKCRCGTELLYSVKNRHYKSNRHIKKMKELLEK